MCVQACHCVQLLIGLLIKKKKEENKPKQRTRKDQKCVQTRVGRISKKDDFLNHLYQQIYDLKSNLFFTTCGVKSFKRFKSLGPESSLLTAPWAPLSLVIVLKSNLAKHGRLNMCRWQIIILTIRESTRHVVV